MHNVHKYAGTITRLQVDITISKNQVLQLLYLA